MKDTDAEHHGSDSEAHRDVSPAEFAYFLLPLRQLHLPDKLLLFPGQLFFWGVYSLRELRLRFGLPLTALVRHVWKWRNVT